MTFTVRTITTTLIALLLITAPMAGSAAAAADGGGTAVDARENDPVERIGNPGLMAEDVPQDQVVNATDDIGIWRGAGFSLRADETAGEIQIDNAIWGVYAPEEFSVEKSLDKSTIAVYDDDATIPLSFDDDDGGAHTALANEEVQLIAARLEGDQSATVSSVSSIDGIRSLLTQDNANDNASFEIVDTTTIESDGTKDFDFEPSEPGQYVLFLATNGSGNGFAVSSGEISQVGPTDIVGVDHVAVQRGSSTVWTDEDTYEAGENVTFTAETDGVVQTSGDVAHAVVLYDEETFTDETFTINVTGEIDSGFEVSEDVVLEHSIAQVNGVGTFDGEANAFGVSVDSRRAAGLTTFQTVLDFIAEDTSVSDSLIPKSDATGTTVWNASATVVNGSPDETVVVETRDDWPDGEYRWVHLATDESGTEFASDTGTIEIGESDDDDSPGGGPPPSRGRDRDRGSVDTPGTSVTTNGRANVQVTDTDRGASIQIDVETPGTSVQIRRSTGQVTSQLQRDGAAMEDMEVDFTGETGFDMEISNTPDKPDPSVPDPPSERGAVGYIDVRHSASDDAVGEVRFTFRVTQERLDDAGIGADEVVLYRYSDDGEWSALETQPAGTADDGSLRFRATSPGLSVFAIGGPQAQQETPDEPTETTTDAPPEETTEEPTETTTIAEPGGFGNVYWIVAFLVILVAVIGGLYWYRQQ